MIKLVSKLENNLLTKNLSIKKIGRNVDQSWRLKKDKSRFTNTNIDQFYTLAKKIRLIRREIIRCWKEVVYSTFFRKKNVSKLKKI